MPKLYDVAHCRAGDKGNTSILSLIAYRPEDYPLLAQRVTVGAVAQHLRGIVQGDIRRYELPQLPALQFVCEHSLAAASRPRSRSTRTASRCRSRCWRWRSDTAGFRRCPYWGSDSVFTGMPGLVPDPLPNGIP